MTERPPDDSHQWFRAYGNENWEFDPMGLMTARHASINETPIGPEERKLHWPLGSSLMLAWLDRS